MPRSQEQRRNSKRKSMRAVPPPRASWANRPAREQPGHHPTVIGAIRGAHCGMDAPALVEGRDREVVEDCAAMPTHGSAGPVIVGERVRSDANLGSQAPDDRRYKVGFFVWETAVLA